MNGGENYLYNKNLTNMTVIDNSYFGNKSEHVRLETLSDYLQINGMFETIEGYKTILSPVNTNAAKWKNYPSSPVHNQHETSELQINLTDAFLLGASSSSMKMPINHNKFRLQYLTRKIDLDAYKMCVKEWNICGQYLNGTDYEIIQYSLNLNYNNDETFTLFDWERANAEVRRQSGDFERRNGELEDQLIWMKYVFKYYDVFMDQEIRQLD